VLGVFGVFLDDLDSITVTIGILELERL
jgi:hypothetical protein